MSIFLFFWHVTRFFIFCFFFFFFFVFFHLLSFLFLSFSCEITFGFSHSSWTAWTLMIRDAKGSGETYAFDTLTVVLGTELTKLVLSIAFHFYLFVFCFISKRKEKLSFCFFFKLFFFLKNTHFPFFSQTTASLLMVGGKKCVQLYHRFFLQTLFHFLFFSFLFFFFQFSIFLSFEKTKQKTIV